MSGRLFARALFVVAGVYGLLVLTPLFFQTPIGAPEFHYGFAAVALAWQFAFLVIATSPLRFRPLMLPSVAEKVLFGAIVVWLWVRGSVSDYVFAAGVIDLVLGALFVIAYAWLGREGARELRRLTGL